MRGFETAVRNVTLGPNTPPVDVVLSVGRVSTTLTVTASAGKATATRLPVADDDVPAQVSSIPQELMRQQGINSVGEALKNASGVQAVRWYGVYEQYTIRGFFDPDRDGFNVVLVDGMRMGGNRYGTQTNNIQSVEVLKGPSSVLYGRGAVGGAINLVRKKPQAVRAYDVALSRRPLQHAPGVGGRDGADRGYQPVSLSTGRQLRKQRRLARRGSGSAERLAVADLDHERKCPPDDPPDLQPRPVRRRRRRAVQHHRPSELQARASLQPAAGQRPGGGFADAQSCSTATSPRGGSSGTRSSASARAIAIS